MEQHDTHTSFQTLLNQFAQQAGLPSLELDDQGHCELLIGQDVVINLQLDEDIDTLITYAIVAPLDPRPDWEELLLQIMKANHFWQETQGFTLALSDDSSQLLIMDKRPLALFPNADALAAYLDTCISQIYTWRERVSRNLLDDLPDSLLEPNTDADENAPDIPENTLQ